MDPRHGKRRAHLVRGVGGELSQRIGCPLQPRHQPVEGRDERLDLDRRGFRHFHAESRRRLAPGGLHLPRQVRQRPQPPADRPPEEQPGDQQHRDADQQHLAQEQPFIGGPIIQIVGNLDRDQPVIAIGAAHLGRDPHRLAVQRAAAQIGRLGDIMGVRRIEIAAHQRRLAIGILEGRGRMAIGHAIPVRAIIGRRLQAGIAGDQRIATIDAVMDHRPGAALEQVDDQRHQPLLVGRRAVIGKAERPDRPHQHPIDRVRLGIVIDQCGDDGKDQHQRRQRHHHRAGQAQPQRGRQSAHVCGGRSVRRSGRFDHIAQAADRADRRA